MNTQDDDDRERSLYLWLWWFIVLLVLVGTFVWWWPRNEAALARTLMTQAADQLPVQFNLARGEWLLRGKPNPLHWPVDDAGATDGAVPVLWFDRDGGLVLDEQQRCEQLWHVLLKRPLQVRDTPIVVTSRTDATGALCEFSAAGVILRWWPVANRVTVTAEPPKV